MAAVSRLIIRRLNLTILLFPSIPGHTFGKCFFKCTPLVSAIRFYKGSARDTRRREWNKKMAELKKQKPRIFDYKMFISTNYEKELFAFSHRLSLDPGNDLLRIALAHKSFLTSDGADEVEHNDKLAVLGFNITTQFIGEFLFCSLTSFPSSGLRSVQDYLVSRRILVKVARSLSIPELIRTPYDLDSSEEIWETNVTKEDIISDSILALIAAIYLREGSDEARSFVHDFILVELYGQELESIIKFKNPEISLATLLQQLKKENPVARMISSSGKHTDTPAYVVGIFSSNLLLAKGVSSILEKAKHEAYCSALAKVLKSSIPQPHGLPSDKANKLRI